MEQIIVLRIKVLIFPNSLNKLKFYLLVYNKNTQQCESCHGNCKEGKCIEPSNYEKCIECISGM